MVLSAIRPVFVGGPLHGQDVEPMVVDLGQDYVAIDPTRPDGVPWACPPARVYYSPRIFNLVSQDATDREVTVRNVFQIKVWVDNRLCEEAANRRMWEVIHGRGWLAVIQPHLVFGMPTPE